MLRILAFTMCLCIFPFSSAWSGGVSDGGSRVATEIDCEFKGQDGLMIFSVFVPPYDLPYGSGNNSALFNVVERNGEEELGFADRFPTARSWVQNGQGHLIRYKEKSPSGAEVTVETQLVELSTDERAKLKFIPKNISWEGYSRASLNYARRNLHLAGICVFRQ